MAVTSGAPWKSADDDDDDVVEEEDEEKISADQVLLVERSMP